MTKPFICETCDNTDSIECDCSDWDCSGAVDCPDCEVDEKLAMAIPLEYVLGRWRHVTEPPRKVVA